jgi:hypothetical protein
VIILPPGLTPTKYPGYYYDMGEKQLYSIKQGGVLRPIKYQPSSFWNKGNGGYTISHKGQKRYLIDEYLQALPLKDHIITKAKPKWA